MYEHTGCDMIMIGRGSHGFALDFFGRQRIFERRKAAARAPVAERMRFMLRQARLMCEYKEPKIACLQMRKQAAWYIKGYKGRCRNQKKVFGITEISQLERLAFEIVEREKNS